MRDPVLIGHEEATRAAYVMRDAAVSAQRAANQMEETAQRITAALQQHMDNLYELRSTCTCGTHIPVNAEP